MLHCSWHSANARTRADFHVEGPGAVDVAVREGRGHVPVPERQRQPIPPQLQTCLRTTVSSGRACIARSALGRLAQESLRGGETSGVHARIQARMRAIGGCALAQPIQGSILRKRCRQLYVLILRS